MAINVENILIIQLIQLSKVEINDKELCDMKR